MKVLLLNGSPHKNGSVFTALNVMAKILENENIETEIFQIGSEILPCKACYACSKLERCVIDDKVNEFTNLMAQSNGLIVGAPVYYASAASGVTSFLDRAFFSGSRRKQNIFAHKPATSFVNARRAGTTAALDQINKYFSISQMPIISGRYWNMVHGMSPEETLKDEEGIQNLEIAAKNMAWFLKCKECALKSGIEPPVAVTDIKVTNFIK